MTTCMNRTLSAWLAASALVVGLAGCATPVVLGGAALGGMVAIDRRTAGTQIEDETIELRSSNRIHGAFGDKVHVNVTSYNRQVLVTGEVGTAEARQEVERIVGGVENVRSVVNELAVMPSTTLGQRSNDTFITGKMRASLVDAKDLSANSFKVVTERNVVYLMGLVRQREAARATSIARGVTGVSKVVRVFEYLSEADLARMTTPRPAPVTQDNGEAAEAPRSKP